MDTYYFYEQYKNKINRHTLQLELIYYMTAKQLWKIMFRNVYDNCDACLTPHLTTRHVCVYLWSYYHLKEQGFAQECIEKYYESIMSQFDWNRVIDQIRPIFDHQTIFPLKWRTRHQKQTLKMSLSKYIMAVSIEEEDKLLLETITDIKKYISKHYI